MTQSSRRAVESGFDNLGRVIIGRAIPEKNDTALRDAGKRWGKALMGYGGVSSVRVIKETSATSSLVPRTAIQVYRTPDHQFRKPSDPRVKELEEAEKALLKALAALDLKSKEVGIIYPQRDPAANRDYIGTSARRLIWEETF